MKMAGPRLFSALLLAAHLGSIAPRAEAKKLGKTQLHLAVDFGSQMLRAALETTVSGHKKALIKPTKDPLVLNLAGQRATKSAVLLQPDGGVLFGDQALAAQVYNPYHS